MDPNELLHLIIPSAHHDKIDIGKLRCVLNSISEIANYVQYIKISNNIARVKLSSSSLRQTMLLKKQIILNKCKNENIKINDIVFF
jgi:hypothetical protein